MTDSFFSGLLTAIYRRHGDVSLLHADPIRHLYELYVEAHRQTENDSSLVSEANAACVGIEQGAYSAKVGISNKVT